MSERIDDGGPAFPMPPHMGVLGHLISGANGMSLRDWFAGQALSGICTDYQGARNTEEWDFVELARGAYMAADAMLAERKRGGAS